MGDLQGEILSRKVRYISVGFIYKTHIKNYVISYFYFNRITVQHAN